MLQRFLTRNESEIFEASELPYSRRPSAHTVHNFGLPANLHISNQVMLMSEKLVNVVVDGEDTHTYLAYRCWWWSAENTCFPIVVGGDGDCLTVQTVCTHICLVCGWCSLKSWLYTRRLWWLLSVVFVQMNIFMLTVFVVVGGGTHANI